MTLVSIESGWFIDDIELPEAPQEDERDISRSFQTETLFQFFPELVKPTAHSFDYTFVGVLYPEHKVNQLDEIAKSADTNTVTVLIPADERIFNTTKFAVKSLKFNRKGPMFVKYKGVIVRAVPFSITFSQLPEEGEVQEGVDGFLEADEGGLGLQGMAELAEETGSDLDILDYSPMDILKIGLGIDAFL